MEKYINRFDIREWELNVYNNAKFKLCLFWSFIFGLLAHGFCYFNIMFCHDSTMVFHNEAKWKVQLGRFITPFFDSFRTPYNIVWIIGIMSLLFVSLAVYCLVCIFEIQNKITIVIIAGLFSTNFTLTITNATYINWSDIYMFSILLYVLGAYFILIKRKILISTLIITMAMGIYQAYLPLTLLIILYYVVIECFNNNSFKDNINIAVRSISVLALSYVLYSLLCKCFVFLYDVSVADTYNGISNITDFKDIDILNLIKNALYHLASFFLKESGYITKGIKSVNVIVFLLIFALLLLILIKKKMKIENLIFSIVCVCISPFVMNCVFVISKGMIHDLMIFHFSMYYVLLLVLLEYAVKENLLKYSMINKIFPVSCYLLVGFVIFRNVTYANIVYLNQKLKYQNTMLVMNRIVDRIEQTDGYIIGETPVEFYGDLNKSPLAKERNGFTQLKELALSDSFGVTYGGTFYLYFDEIFNYPINISVYDVYSGVDCPYDIPVFPYAGSVQMIDGKIIVRLSETY